MQVFKLDNGLTVLLKENHANPIVTVDVWVNAGSMDEPAPINGISHFLEHMMFKGTDKRPVGQIDLEIERVGGETNAATSKDFTHYYVTLASEFVTTGLDVLADVMMNSTLDPTELERERQVILEEYRRKQDSPFNHLYDELFETAFRAGPYKQSVIGTSETISSITRDQMLDYYHRHYAPDNMVLVIVGDVDAQTIRPQVERYFGRFDRRGKPLENLDAPTRWAGPAERVIDKDVRDTYAFLAFPAPGIAQVRETVIMDVLMTILGEGRSSRLYQTLREEKQLVSSVGAAYGTQEKPGVFFVYATLEAKDLKAMREATLEEIRRIRRRTVGLRELAKAKKVITNGYYFSNETTSGVASSLGHFFTISAGPEYEARYLREVARVSAGDVRRVARKYLDPDKVVAVVLQPRATNASSSGGQ